ncbi:hypothetical protein [Streptomyces sp. SP18CS02]|uniref:hypothetical protein n=1 Tax=Streptomyces sp. SP18CS02 TaxID=3002531 RepID=UPI002E79A0C2|nr:hypothetical protein [Streptomyces sp. SP18CS02]MEE1754537.1 hypothetical protein [Streptomyces sp. SP18CS02]
MSSGSCVSCGPCGSGEPCIPADTRQWPRSGAARPPRLGLRPPGPGRPGAPRPSGPLTGPARPEHRGSGRPGRPAPRALFGPLADQAIRALQVDLLIVGAHGVSERAGVTTPNLAEAETDRAMIAATRLAVVADHSKWGIVGLSRFAGLSEIDYFVSDDGPGTQARTVLGEQVGHLVLADAQGAP